MGTGRFRILRDNAEFIKSRLGIPVKSVKIAVRDLKRGRGIEVPPDLLTERAAEWSTIRQSISSWS